MRDAEVIVVGAGPAGATAAASLAARGVRVILVDRAVFPRGKPCGDYCNPGAVNLLETMGLLPDLAGGGAGFVDGMTVAAQDGATFTAPFPTGRGMLLRRERLDAILLRRAERAGVALVEDYRVDAVAVDGGVEVRDQRAGRRPLRGTLLIAADGMRSTIARRLGLLRHPPDGRFTVGAYFSGAGGPPGGELHLGKGFYGGVAQFGDGAANVCLALPRALLRGRSAQGAFEAAVQRLPALRDRVAGWRREGAFRVTGPVGFAARPVAAARTLLAGDAAGQVEPLTGQGVAFALRSGLLAAGDAAAALRSGDLSEGTLRAHALRRARGFAGKIRLSRAVVALALRPWLAPALVRRLAARPDLARRLLGATGDVMDPQAVLSPGYVLRLLLGFHAHAA